MAQRKKPAKSYKGLTAGHVSSGNVFADLGLAHADELIVKADLVRLIGRLIDRHGLTQIEAADRMTIRQPDVSKLLKGRFAGFSIERLLFFVRSLGNDIEIKVTPTKTRREGRLSMTA